MKIFMVKMFLAKMAKAELLLVKMLHTPFDVPRFLIMKDRSIRIFT